MTGGHVFSKWGPRGPFRVYTWTQSAVTTAGIVVAALLLVVGLQPQAVVLLTLAGLLLVRTPTGLPVWTQVGAGLAFLIRRHRPTNLALLDSVEIHAVAVGGGVMGVAEDDGRFLAAMRIAPLTNHWLASDAERQIAAEDWAQLVVSVPRDKIDRIQIVVTTRSNHRNAPLIDAPSSDSPAAEVLDAASGLIASACVTSETLLVVRLTRRSTDASAQLAGETLHVALQQIGSQLATETIWAEILSPTDWNTILDVSALNDDGVVSVPRERWSGIEEAGRRTVGVWVWDWPQRAVPVGFLTPIVTGRDRTVSLLIEPSDPETHQRNLDYAFRRAEAATATATGGKHRKQAELEALDRQLSELTAGHIPIRALLTAAASDTATETVEQLVDHIHSDAIAASTRSVALGGFQQVLVGSVAPLCRGVDRSAL